MENERIATVMDHLFRHESGKIVSVLTKIVGPSNIELAEDVVQDSMTDALEQWSYKGVPDNPAGWLYKVAKFKALNILRKENSHRKYQIETGHLINSTLESSVDIEEFFSDEEIADDQLRMMFTCCHPSISSDSQIALTLKTLCGFSAKEIANAFLTNEDNINKRLFRARKVIRENKVSFEVPVGTALEPRLQTVLDTIYLLFNEGYNATEGSLSIRWELCEEAVRLAMLLGASELVQDKNEIWALLALMLLNASRFNARVDKADALVDMANQDRSLWDKQMIDAGLAYLDRSIATGNVSSYQINAAISAHHCTASSESTTNWENILKLYDNLAAMDPSPLVLLNRAVALSKTNGPQKGVDALITLQKEAVLMGYPYYHAVLGEFYLELKQEKKALVCFKKALKLVANNKEKRHLENKVAYCKSVI